MVRPGSPLAAAALLFVAMFPRSAWAHDWGGGAFIMAFIMMIAVPLGLMGIIAGLIGGSGVKTFFGTVMVMVILACLGLWMFVIPDPRIDLAGHALLLSPTLLPLLGAWLCLRRPRITDDSVDGSP
jgi:hypothetical protein